jgi:hypothetical protein
VNVELRGQIWDQRDIVYLRGIAGAGDLPRSQSVAQGSKKKNCREPRVSSLPGSSLKIKLRDFIPPVEIVRGW